MTDADFCWVRLEASLRTGRKEENEDELGTKGEDEEKIRGNTKRSWRKRR